MDLQRLIKEEIALFIKENREIIVKRAHKKLRKIQKENKGNGKA